MTQEYKYMVVTRCYTYNHAAYIVNAMNGFTMQQTTFPVVTLLVDDASTDGEQDIILNYLKVNFQQPYRREETEDFHLICANHNNNNNCTFVVILLKYNHYSIKKSKIPYISEWINNTKYCAVCEGDDYWITSSKLQRQFDFLENHHDYSMCFTAVNNINMQNNIIYASVHSKEDCVIPPNAIIHGGGLFVPFCSLFYLRNKTVDKPSFYTMADVGDGPLSILLSLRGKVYYFAEIMACYRISNSESWTGQIKRNKEKQLAHFVNGCNWYRELDNYTNQQYHHDVFYRICLVSGLLYQNDIISGKEYFCNVKELDWGREKFFFVKSFYISVFVKNCPPKLFNALRKCKRFLINKKD